MEEKDLLYKIECEILKKYYKVDQYRDKLKRQGSRIALEELERKSFYMMGLRDSLEILMRISNKNKLNLNESEDFEQFIKEKYKTNK